MKSGELVNMKRQHQLYSGVELVTAYINKHCCMRTNSYIKITFAPPKNAYHMLCTWLHCLLNCCKKQILFFCQMLKRCRESNITFLLKYTIDRFNNLTKMNKNNYYKRDTHYHSNWISKELQTTKNTHSAFAEVGTNHMFVDFFHLLSILLKSSNNQWKFLQ